ncbi:hypothetical protein EP51_46780 (plasmid) [Rhodococcus opacus]|uniref:Uncharacterized protein n=2 Tax=Rhodococcus opacus TaxID=37919 RepID=A0A076EZU2_RHOOP|nr:hypothetical protein EP51_46780 [Rhodococcus opacus]
MGKRAVEEHLVDHDRVDVGPHRIPHTRSAAAYRLRTRIDLDPISIPDAARGLAEQGIRIRGCITTTG